MRILPITLLMLVLFAQAVRALDITTADGQTYKQCEVTRVEPDALRISHTNGAARITYEKLPPALQRQYFDPAKVAAYHKQVEDARQAAEAKAAEERRLHDEATAKAAKAERERLAEQARQEQESREVKEQEQREQREAEERQKTLQTVLSVVGIVLAIVVGLFFYFIPSIVGRHKTNAGAIFVFNFFLGWTFLGWVLALVWACTKDSAMDTLARQRMNMPRERGPYLE